MVRLAWALVPVAACVGQGTKDTATVPTGLGATWWEDPCGRRDPVEGTCPTGVPTVEVGADPTCADAGISPGDPCDAPGATCLQLRPIACEDAPEDVIASDAVLTCGAEPPPDTCPISRRSAKQDVAYLDAAGRDAVAAEVLALRLARYTYRDPAHGVGPQLGYLLDDAPDASFSGPDRVNLYAYTSAVLAAVQAQQDEIAALRAEVARLRAGECPAAAVEGR